MKIAFLTDSVSRRAGGLFDANRHLAHALAETGAEVQVFGVADSDSDADRSVWPVPVTVATATGPKSLARAPQLGVNLGRFNCDVLHRHGLWTYPSVQTTRWRKRTNRPVIIHPHGMLDPWAVNNSKWKKRLAAWAFEDRNLRGAACIRALCESEALSIRGYGLKNPICIIPNGVALPDVSRNLRDDDCVSEGDGRKTLLYLGRLHPKKNLGPLLYAWAQLQRDNAAAQNWTLAIVGWDENGFEEQLRALWADVGAGLRNCGVTSVQGGGSIQKRGLSYSSPPSMGGNQLSCVHFLGARFGEGKAACYSDCDGFVLPSLSEGLPMVVLEAWAYGKPVVMTTACNLPEGFSARAAVPIGTSAAGIAAGLITLIEMSDSDRSAMGRRGRELVRSKFAWPRIGEEMRRVCEWVVGGGLQPVSVRV